LTLGNYDNFPQNIHHVENYISITSSRQLQQKLIQILGKLNCLEFTFEEVSIPTIPEGRVIFEFGLAEAGNFNFIDEAEVERALGVISKEQVKTLDFFCSIRYYKGSDEKKSALKFDYFMMRIIFGKGTLEVQVFHERGPRYLSPQEITTFLFNSINKISGKRILKEIIS